MTKKALRAVDTVEQQAEQAEQEKSGRRAKHKEETEDLSPYTFSQLSKEQLDDALKTLLISNGIISPG